LAALTARAAARQLAEIDSDDDRADVMDSDGDDEKEEKSAEEETDGEEEADGKEEKKAETEKEKRERLKRGRLEKARQRIEECKALRENAAKLAEKARARLVAVREKKGYTVAGWRVATLNMHLHTHLAICHLNFGTAHAFWLFPHERINGSHAAPAHAPTLF
jgi:hypothetical protein